MKKELLSVFCVVLKNLTYCVIKLDEVEKKQICALQPRGYHK